MGGTIISAFSNTPLKRIHLENERRGLGRANNPAVQIRYVRDLKLTCTLSNSSWQCVQVGITTQREAERWLQTPVEARCSHDILIVCQLCQYFSCKKKRKWEERGCDPLRGGSGSLYSSALLEQLLQGEIKSQRGIA